MTKVLIVGSGFTANEVNDYDYKNNGWTIVAINNGWMACANYFDYHMYPNDYTRDRKVVPNYLPHQKYFVYTQDDLRPYGGQAACGQSATLNIGYAVLRRLKPRVIGFLGCDMNYTPREDGATAIYGVGHDIATRGISDPDSMVKRFGKDDPNYLHDIYTRFSNVAKEHNCDVYNFSSDENTRLPYPKASPEDFR